MIEYDVALDASWPSYDKTPVFSSKVIWLPAGALSRIHLTPWGEPSGLTVAVYTLVNVSPWLSVIGFVSPITSIDCGAGASTFNKTLNVWDRGLPPVP